MKLKLDEKGNVLLVDGKPVYKGYEQKLADANALVEKVQGQLHTE